MTLYRNLNLNFKLLFALIGTLLIVIFIIILLLISSFDQFAIASGQDEARAEISFLEARIDELSENLLFASKQVASDSDLKNIMVNNDQERLRTFFLKTLAQTRTSEIDVVDASGQSILFGDEGVSTTEDLVSLALIGSELVRVTFESQEEGEGQLRLTAVVPIIASNGNQLGALLMAQTMDDAFLDNLNFERQTNHLVLIYEENPIALTSVINESYDVLTIPKLLDTAHLNQAQDGAVYIDNQINYTANGFPQLYAHMPLEVGGRINSILTVVIDMQSFFSLRDTILQALIGSFAGLMVVLGALLIFVLRRNVITPLKDIQSAVQEMIGGNYQLQITGLSADEIGQLGDAFNTMAQTVQERQEDVNKVNQTLEQQLVELGKARDKALAAQRIADENSRLKSEFLSMMSHELRTPMNAIEGFTSIMLNGLGGVEFNDKADDFLRRIQSNSKRLLALINDFLDLSRVESGRIELAHMPFSSRQLVASWQAEIGILADKKNILLETNIDDGIPETLSGDAEAISKIVINLLSNAIKFTEEGQVTLSLKCSENNKWDIIVQDTGIGIPPHAREYIFDEFRQVDQSSKRKYGGTGLGLAISQKLVRVMGGSISLQSEIGQGSTFTVTLPV